MKADHVEISNITKFHAFRLNKNQAIDLETWFKIDTNVSVMLRQRSPKPDRFLKFL